MANKSKLLANLSSSISAIIGEIRYVNARINFGQWLMLNGQTLNRITYLGIFNTYIQTISGNITSGSSIISNLSSTTTLKVGMKIEGAGIPTGATIVTIVSGTSITISANATATITGVSIKFFALGCSTGDGSTTFTLPDWRGKLPISEATNIAITTDFMLISGVNDTLNDTDRLGSTGNWFIFSGV